MIHGRRGSAKHDRRAARPWWGPGRRCGRHCGFLETNGEDRRRCRKPPLRFAQLSRLLRRTERTAHGFGQVIALIVGWEGAVLDVFAIVLDGGAEQCAGVGITADKLCRRREGEVDEVVEDEDLTIATGT